LVSRRHDHARSGAKKEALLFLSRAPYIPAVNHAIDLVIFAILTLAGLVMGVISYIDGLLGVALAAAHVPPNAQIVLLAVVAICLFIVGLRLLGRVFAALIIVLLLLLLVRAVFPHAQVPNGHLPPGFSLPAADTKTI
jgi:hypothetical protein